MLTHPMHSHLTQKMHERVRSSALPLFFLFYAAVREWWLFDFLCARASVRSMLLTTVVMAAKYNISWDVSGAAVVSGVCNVGWRCEGDDGFEVLSGLNWRSGPPLSRSCGNTLNNVAIKCFASFHKEMHLNSAPFPRRRNGILFPFWKGPNWYYRWRWGQNLRHTLLLAHCYNLLHYYDRLLLCCHFQLIIACTPHSSSSISSSSGTV